MFLPGVGAIVLGLFFVVGTVFFGNLNNSGILQIEPQEQINQTISMSEDAVVVKKEADFSKMKSVVGEIVSENAGDFGIAFKDLTTDKSWEINGDKIFTAASTMKVLSVSGLYNAIERDLVSLDKRVGGVALQEHARLALEVSDNNSWETINTVVGYKNLQNFALGLRLTNINVFDNTIDAVDFRNLLEKLYSGQLLNNENTNEVLSYMDHTETENRIPAGVDGAEIIYHKTGTLDALTHDGGIIRSGKGDYILTVYTENLLGNVDARSAVIAQISNAVWNEYLVQIQN